ncbi:hypothetical protein LMG29542_01462 [Paraburkholderia humisilvae]|uniref:Uncharacterized protein n=1 Tax=Paraburkholderia humisilvae TaxID=627669 RepID=A0A6J5DE92_9BURK|nr:hypothetical protein LMG29542_01462 [Paraburkholderia humisilvae]
MADVAGRKPGMSSNERASPPMLASPFSDRLQAPPQAEWHDLARGARGSKAASHMRNAQAPGRCSARGVAGTAWVTYA